jgi:hypothetical protein
MPDGMHIKTLAHRDSDVIAAVTDLVKMMEVASEPKNIKKTGYTGCANRFIEWSGGR